jgi:hypothetical protein
MLGILFILTLKHLQNLMEVIYGMMPVIVQVLVVVLNSELVLVVILQK